MNKNVLIVSVLVIALIVVAYYFFIMKKDDTDVVNETEEIASKSVPQSTDWEGSNPNIIDGKELNPAIIGGRTLLAEGSYSYAAGLGGMTVDGETGMFLGASVTSPVIFRKGHIVEIITDGGVANYSGFVEVMGNAQTRNSKSNPGDGFIVPLKWLPEEFAGLNLAERSSGRYKLYSAA